MMNFLIDLISGFVALLAAAALSQFGVDLTPPAKGEREVHRTADCRDAPPAAAMGQTAKRDC
ncbi:hypothetical protein [Brevundimonas sp.]|uniref:hypothetical protein n=1 Tax=Brevundimonas sp. TaxID=1871086 RepID=UPI003BAA7A6E